jgi:hypothetical protein
MGIKVDYGLARSDQRAKGELYLRGRLTVTVCRSYGFGPVNWSPPAWTVTRGVTFDSHERVPHSTLLRGDREDAHGRCDHHEAEARTTKGSSKRTRICGAALGSRTPDLRITSASL